jgi:hypothetical protein
VGALSEDETNEAQRERRGEVNVKKKELFLED